MNLDKRLGKTNLEDSIVFVNSFDFPALLMQTDPRQVVTASHKACELFNKTLAQIEGYRGGQVFDCIYSFTEKGCGRDPNCEDCKIKNAVIDTFSSGNSHEGIQTILEVKKNNVVTPYILNASTRKVGDLALVTISKYEKKSLSSH
jgi:hypothetical protein